MIKNTKNIVIGLTGTYLLYNLTNRYLKNPEETLIIEEETSDLEQDNLRNINNNNDLESKIILTNAEIKAKKMILEAEIEISKMKSELELLKVKIEADKIISDAQREADKTKYKDKQEKMKIIADVYQKNKELFDKYGNYVIPLILDL